MKKLILLTMAVTIITGCSIKKSANSANTKNNRNDRISEEENKRLKQGIENLKLVDGEAGEKVISSLESISPDLGRYVLEFTFGDIYSREGLTLQEREMITITNLLTAGGNEPQLEVHINASLNVGISPEKIIETFIQNIPYTGFPKVLNAVNVAKKVFIEKGIVVNNELYSSKNKFNSNKEKKDRLNRGIKKLNEVEKRAVKNTESSLETIAPDLAVYIFEFAFGDIYSREGLTLQEREMITITSLLVAGGNEPQLEVHIKASLNVGIPPEKIIEIFIQNTPYVGFPRVLNAVNVAKEVFDEEGIVIKIEENSL